MKYMLSTGVENFNRGSATIDRLGSFFGQGIFLSNESQAKEVCSIRSTCI